MPSAVTESAAHRQTISPRGKFDESCEPIWPLVFPRLRNDLLACGYLDLYLRRFWTLGLVVMAVIIAVGIAVAGACLMAATMPGGASKWRDLGFGLGLLLSFIGVVGL